MENLKQAVINYFKGVRLEWGKIVWPEKNQVVVYLIWVLVICTAFTLLIYLLDIGFEAVLNLIPKK